MVFMIMEYIPEMRISLKSLFCVGLCLLVYVDTEMSLKCGRYTCGYGTGKTCGADGQCLCRDKFLLRRQQKLFGSIVQFCLENCEDRNCSDNYRCRVDKTPHRCICAPEYRRSGFAECVESCDVLDCEVGQRCSEATEGAVCGSDCVNGYQPHRTNTKSCIDFNECTLRKSCADLPHSRCVNFPGSYLCECVEGYQTSDTDAFCEDTDECLDGGVCDVKNSSVCVNTNGSFICECLPGYTSHDNSSCQVEDKSAGLTGSPPDVSLYIGVTVGVLVVLGLVFGTILIRRRRISKTSSKGTETADRPKSDHTYDTISLGNEDFKRRDNVSAEYPNSTTSQNKLDRSQNSISVEYSNHKVPSSKERNIGKTDCIKFAPQCMIESDQSEGKGVYSDPYEENVLPQNNNQVTSNTSVKFEERAAFNKSDTLSLNTDVQPNTDQYESIHGLSGEVPKFQESDACNTLHSVSYNVLQSNVNSTLYSDDYNTLASCNLNETDKMKVGNIKTEDQNVYNVLYGTNVDVVGGERRVPSEDKSDTTETNCK